MRRSGAVTSAVISRPVDEVFAWVTTPVSLLHASPITLRIESSNPDRPLRAGDAFREHTPHGHFDWTVEVLDAPNRCVLTADNARVEMTCEGDAYQTRLTREVSHHLSHAAEATLTTMASILENPLLRGPRPDATDERWLHEADPLADDAVASLVSPSGDSIALERFIAGLYRGAPQSDDLPEPMRRFFEVTSALPSWTCQPRLESASDVFLDWGVLAIGAHICASLPETYVMPRVAKLLHLTRQLDADPQHADRRLWFTVRMCFDVLARNGLGPKGEGMLALQRLRLIHAVVRLFVQHRLENPHRLSKLSSTALWDVENGKPISQLELLHTLLTFSHVVIRALEILGAELTPYQREAYIHIWNVAGVQLGIRPELLPRDASDAAKMFDAIKTRYAAATPDAIELGRALIWFWTSLFPGHVRDDGRDLMCFVISRVLSPETAKMNGLDDLPEFSPAAAHAVKTSLDAAGRLCTNAFEDVPGARQATALFISLLMRAKTHEYEHQSGTFDIPLELYERWRGIPATA